MQSVTSASSHAHGEIAVLACGNSKSVFGPVHDFMAAHMPGADWCEERSLDALLSRPDAGRFDIVLVWQPELAPGLADLLSPFLRGHPGTRVILVVDKADPSQGGSLLEAGVEDIVTVAEMFRLLPAFRRSLGGLVRKQAEPARHDGGAQGVVGGDEAFRTLLDHMPALVGYWDREQCNRFVNKDCRSWFGVDPAWMAGRHIREVLGEQAYRLNQPYIEAALRGEPQHFEQAIPFPDGGGVSHAQTRYIPDVRDGSVRGFYVLITDVTAMKNAQTALRNSEVRLRAILDILPVGVLLTDPAGKLVDCNPGACRLLDLSREELLSRHISSPEWHFRRGGIPVAADDYVSSRALREGRSIHAVETEYLHAGGRRWFSVSAMPVALPQYGVVVAFVDVTGQRALEDERMAMRRQIEKMSRDQVAFQTLAGLAHGFNQPLSAIGFYLESALRMARSEETFGRKLESPLEGALVEVHRAGGVLRELLSHVDTPRTNLELHDLSVIVFDCLNKQDVCSSGCCRIRLECADTPVNAMVNPRQTELIIENLLRNSGEAMGRAGYEEEEGEIVITVTGQGDVACVCVRDNGPGIAEEIERRIFEPFFSTKEECTGMGLAISRTLVEAQGGRIWHEPAGPGAKFCFTVPMAK